MAFIRSSDSRLLGHRWHAPRLFARRHDAFFSSAFASLAVRISFTIVLGALLYSVATGIAAAEETNAPRTLQSIASIRSAAEQFVRDCDSGKNGSGNSGASGGTLLVSAAELDARLQLDQCPAALNVFTLNSAPITARTTLGVRCPALTSDGKPSGADWTVYVPVTVETEIDVLVLRSSMPREAHIAAEDLTIEHRRVPGLGNAYIGSVTQLQNLHFKHGAPAGAALMNDMLARDLVVKRGQQVLLVFDSGGVVIQARGLALTEGGTADRIRVQNQTSLKVVEGVIESGNLVRVGM